MPPSRFVRLTEEEDARLRGIEQFLHLKPKVRLRAQVLRLSHRGSDMEAIASYTGRSPQSVGRDLDRWEERGVEGLADGTAPGNPPRVTEEVRVSMEDKLAEEKGLERHAARRGGRRGLRDRGDAGGDSPAPRGDGLLLEAHPLRALQTAGPRNKSARPERSWKR